MFFKRLIKSLSEAHLKYAVVGGYAVALHGAVRGTVDIDLVIALDEKSLESVEKVMRDMGLQSRLPITAKDIATFRDEYIKNRNLIAWSFANPKNPTEVVDILITTDFKEIKTVNIKYGDLNIKIISIPDLIKMKKKSGRPQDLEDVKALEKLI